MNATTIFPTLTFPSEMEGRIEDPSLPSGMKISDLIKTIDNISNKNIKIKFRASNCPEEDFIYYKKIIKVFILSVMNFADQYEGHSEISIDEVKKIKIFLDFPEELEELNAFQYRKFYVEEHVLMAKRLKLLLLGTSS